MMFNFQAFITELRIKEDKKEMIEKYEKRFGPIVGDIKDQQWFKEYVINFGSVVYRVPEELTEEFDRKLLLQLVGASFSSECLLEKDHENPESGRDLTISVKSGDQSITKRVGELRSFQLIRLYEIYIEEEMNLQILLKEEEAEAEAIVSQRHLRLERRKLMLDSLDRDELKKEAKAEQENKLSDLMSQL